MSSEFSEIFLGVNAFTFKVLVEEMGLKKQFIGKAQ